MERDARIAHAPVAGLLRAHEELLRAGGPAFHVGVVRGRALSFGVGVPADRPYLRNAGRAGVATSRRSSGGSGVLHLDGDLVWAVVLPREDPRVGRDFVRAYGRLGRAVVAGLSRSGVVARWVGPPGLADDYCPLSSRGEVLEAAGGIAGAAAQHLSSAALLHQGCVSWTVDRAEVDRLFELPAGGPSARLGGIRDLASGLGPDLLARAVAEALSAELGSRASSGA